MKSNLLVTMSILGLFAPLGWAQPQIPLDVNTEETVVVTPPHNPCASVPVANPCGEQAPATIAETEIVSEEHSDPIVVYPRRFVDRPLILPKGYVEGVGEISSPTISGNGEDGLDLFELANLGVGAKYSIGRVEFGIGGELQLSDGPLQETDVIESFSAVVAYSITSPLTTRLYFDILTPTEDAEKTVNVTAEAQYYIRVETRAAIDLRAGVAFSNSLLDPEPVDAVWTLDIPLFAEYQLQWTDDLALAAGLGFSIRLDESPKVSNVDWSPYGSLAAIYSISNAADVYVRMVSGGNLEEKVWTFGFAGRRSP